MRGGTHKAAQDEQDYQWYDGGGGGALETLIIIITVENINWPIYIYPGGMVYCFCSEGIGRAPAVAVAYYHWVQGLSLSSAYKLVTACQASAPNQWALHQATLDLLASRY